MAAGNYGIWFGYLITDSGGNSWCPYGQLVIFQLLPVILSQGFLSAITEKKAAKQFDLEGTHHKQKSILWSVVVVSCWPK